MVKPSSASGVAANSSPSAQRLTESMRALLKEKLLDIPDQASLSAPVGDHSTTPGADRLLKPGRKLNAAAVFIRLWARVRLCSSSNASTARGLEAWMKALLVKSTRRQTGTPGHKKRFSVRRRRCGDDQVVGVLPS